MDNTNPFTGEVLESPTPAEPRRRSGRRVAGVALVGVAAAVVGAAAVGIAAADDSATPTPAPSSAPGTPGWGRGDGDRDGDGAGHRGRMGHGMLGGGGAVRGELVVPDADGDGYQTVLMQRGEVTKVSATSITVKSTDGHVATYDVTSATIVHAESDGITAISAGDEVVVRAVEDGGTPTALHVGDVSAMKGRHGGPGRGQASPSPSAAA